MDFLLDALTDWLKEMLVGGIMSNLSGMFDSVNQQVGDIATQVGQSPQGWNGSIFSMIQNLSNSIMVPIAGVILAIVMTMELIQLITDKNNLHDVDTWIQLVILLVGCTFVAPRLAQHLLYTRTFRHDY